MSLSQFSLSPDGRRVTIVGTDRDVWIQNLSSGSRTRLTDDAVGHSGAIWTPDGRRVAFGSQDAPLSWRAADGTGQVEVLAEGLVRFPLAFSTDGHSLVFQQGEIGDNADIWLLNLDGVSPATPLLNSRFNEQNAALSPNGRFIAYETDETGQLEVVVRPFPAVDQGRWSVSAAGGRCPLWGTNGREFFYVDKRSQLVAVAIRTEPTFEVGAAAVLFDMSTYSSSLGQRALAVHPDGARFLLLKTSEPQEEEDTAERRIVVVLNWFEELKAEVPAGT